MMSKVCCIAAVDEQFGFGKDRKIPWHFPEDLKHFKNLTEGASLVMGRNTYEDMLSYVKGGKFMPSRHCAVITSSDEPSPWENVTFAKSLPMALKSLIHYEGDVFFIGGERVFESALDISDKVYLTVVPGDYNCDRFFPKKKLLNNYELTNSKISSESELIFREYTRKGIN